MNRNAALDSLLNTTPRLWRGQEPNRSQRTVTSGYARLDTRLPGGGWPLGAVTELISARAGLGEFSLLFPALSAVIGKGQWLVLVDPPWIPYPAALHAHGLALERLLLVRSCSTRESLWACEQALHGSQGGAVLAWPERAGAKARQQVSFARLRRLQLAAEAGAKLAFLFRPEPARASASPCALRLHLEGEDARTRIDILKCRGTRPGEPVWLPRLQASNTLSNGDRPAETNDGLPVLPLSHPAVRPVSTALN